MTDNVQQKTGNLNDILKIMSKANESFVYEVYIPSLDKPLMFREINTAQQKRLLKAIIDSPAYNTEFIFALREIIKENCVDNTIDVGQFTIFDKMIIAMKMRAMSISNDLDLQFTIPNTEKTITRRLSISDLIDKAIEEIKVAPAEIKDEQGRFVIFCDLPTINDEFRLETELRKNVTTVEIKNEKELRETVGEVFTNEIVKYIKKINITSNDGQIIELDLKDLKFTDRLAILAKIPAKINNHIIQYINSVTKEFEKVILFKEDIDGTVVEQRLKIDASFFTVS